MSAVPALRFFILGPLRVTRDDIPCAPSAPMQRALLALLLTRANQYTPTRTIINELWSYRPPRSATAALQLYVSAVRRRLHPNHDKTHHNYNHHPILPTLPNGYQLNIDANQLDLDTFHHHAHTAQQHLDAGHCHTATTHLHNALASWRGNALADIQDITVLHGFAARLEEERLQARQQLIWIDLRHGRAAAVIGELTELADGQPLRETLQCQLMIALTLAGRRVDALDVYARTYRTLVDRAGLEPGHLMRATQRALLAEEPAARDHRLVDLIPITACGCGRPR
jgi:DNA-binding SARP family transcriptional activator